MMVLLVVAALGAGVTLVYPQWVEALLGVDPDGGTGGLEAAVAVLALVVIVAVLLSRAWRRWRRSRWLSGV